MLSFFTHFFKFQASKEHLEEHYADLKKKPFFPGLVEYMSSGPVVPMVWEGLNVVKTGRGRALLSTSQTSMPGDLYWPIPKLIYREQAFTGMTIFEPIIITS